MQKLVIVFASLATLALTACGPTQSPECAQWLECQAAIDEELGTDQAADLEADYGPTGTCWSTTAEAAQGCTTACIGALDGLADSFPEIEACQPAVEAEEG